MWNIFFKHQSISDDLIPTIPPLFARKVAWCPNYWLHNSGSWPQPSRAAGPPRPPSFGRRIRAAWRGGLWHGSKESLAPLSPPFRARDPWRPTPPSGPPLRSRRRRSSREAPERPRCGPRLRSCRKSISRAYTSASSSIRSNLSTVFISCRY
jgi:hypothetical protein